MILFAAINADASEEADNPDTQPSIVTKLAESVDSTHKTVCDMVEDMAKSIDLFFADDRAFEEDNKSSIQLRLDLLSDEDRLFQFKGRVRTKLRLPGTERRLRLTIESEQDAAQTDSEEEDPVDSDETSNNYIIGLEGEQLRGDWHLRPTLGIKAKWRPELYARYKATRYFDLEPWVARVSGNARWNSSDGVKLSVGTDFNRRVSDELLFRSATNVSWKDQDSTTSASEVLTLYQEIANNARLAYDAGMSGDDNPNWRVTDYFIRLRFRQLVYKNWAYIEIQPKVNWPEDNSFNDRYSLLLRLEVNFGSKYRLN